MISLKHLKGETEVAIDLKSYATCSYAVIRKK